MSIDWNDFNTVFRMCAECLSDSEVYAIAIHTDIAGNTIEAIDDCIYAMFGYHSFKQFYYSELV